jgi:hypothetical protein
MLFSKQQTRHLSSLLILTIILWGCTTTVAAPLPTPTVKITPSSTPIVTRGTVALPKQSPTSVAVVSPVPTNTPTSTPSATKTPLPTSTHTPTPEVVDDIENVVIISIDGLRPDALAIADTPALDALQATGAYSAKAQSVLPSVTLVNHASMLSGLLPANHGIDWNNAEPELGKIKGTTLFSVAHQAGLRTVMVVGKPKLDHIDVPGTVDNFLHAGYTDAQVANQAREVIREEMPQVLFIHLPDVDSAGHMTGWMSPGQLLAVTHTDKLVGEIISELAAGDHLQNTLLIITADHGGSGTSHGSDSPEDTTIPWLAIGPGVPAGQSLTSTISIMDTAPTALYALHLSIPDEWDGKAVLEIFE